MKTKKYWLKGGIIAAALFLLNWLLAFVEFISCFDDKSCGIISYLPSLEIIVFLRQIFYPLDDDFIIPLLGVVFVILGMLIGWLYGNVKNKPQVAVLRKILAVMVVIAAYAVSKQIDVSHANFGGVNHTYFPFPVRVTSCGSSYDAYSTCTHPYIWWGIAASVAFWIVILIVAYLIGKKRKNGESVK